VTMIILFYIAAAVAIISTLMVITCLNAVHALLYLVVSLLSIAMIFFTFGAPFVAALEVIVYAGAIIVLFIFVVMMLNLGQQTIEQERSWLKPRGWIGPSLLSLVLLVELILALSQGSESILGGGKSGVEPIAAKQVGISLFGPYVLGVELAAMLLLAGLVGAYHLGRRDGEEA